MMDKYSLENCSDLWAQAGKHGTVEERIARTTEWMPYYEYLANGRMGVQDRDKGEPSVNPFVEFMCREKIITKESTLLDIGAGMGDLDLELARYCGKVTALEPTRVCLDVLEKNASSAGLTNIETICDFWERFHTEKRYDVTFASMCPAICSVDELFRMEKMTGRTCCILTVTRGSVDKHRKTMMTELGIKPRGGMVSEALHYINALYLMGRQPNVKCITTRRSSSISAERVMEQYPIYFKIFGVPEEKSMAFLQGYLERNAVDGYLEDEIVMNQALVYWEVPR
jgi:protein-L-isoaspartate O-methyltransferase